MQTDSKNAENCGKRDCDYDKHKVRVFRINGIKKRDSERYGNKKTEGGTQSEEGQWYHSEDEQGEKRCYEKRSKEANIKDGIGWRGEKRKKGKYGNNEGEQE